MTKHLLLFALLLLLAGCPASPPKTSAPTPSPTPLPFQEILDSEAVLWGLSEAVSKLGRDLRNLDSSLSSFSPYLDSQVALNSPTPVVSGTDWTTHSLSGSKTEPSERIALWTDFLATIDSFDWLSLSGARGKFLGPDRQLWQGEYYLNALASTKDGQRQAFKGKLRLSWRRDGENWRLTELRLLELNSMSAEGSFFSDETEGAIPDPETYARLRDSVGERVISEYLDEPENKERASRVINPHSDLAMAFHPAVSVVDLNQDGWDDLYLCRRYETNSALINQGDGTFRDEATRFGLDIKGDSTCALFADFDNDGDQDLFLGRYYSTSQYLENVDGRFRKQDRTLPEGVTSASAADINSDGLLDLFAAVYVPFPSGYPLEKAREFSPQLAESRKQELELNRATVYPFTAQSDETLQELLKRPDNHIFASRFSTPSVLLLNTGKTGFAPQQIPEELYSNCMHGAFADLDQDGDPDLLSANPNGPNTLLTNENGRFVVAPDKNLLGNAMGAAWGDYDGDGDLDPYLSIMYSKANLRIGLPEHHRFTPGNVLFRNGSGRFEQSSGDGKLRVDKAGWSWGSQFVDLDNDGALDIFALSGFYSAPARFALPVDQ